MKERTTLNTSYSQRSYQKLHAKKRLQHFPEASSRASVVVVSAKKRDVDASSIDISEIKEER